MGNRYRLCWNCQKIAGMPRGRGKRGSDFGFFSWGSRRAKELNDYRKIVAGTTIVRASKTNLSG